MYMCVVAHVWHNATITTYILCFAVTDTVEVISLYKGLLPSEFQSSLSNLHPTEPPPLEGEALTRATMCLIDFLNQALLTPALKIYSNMCCSLRITTSKFEN